MKPRRVVIVAFPGLQPLDAVGPFEVFSGAGRVLAGLGRPGGYLITLASAGGTALRTGSGMGLSTEPLPDPRERIDTLVIPGGDGVEAARGDPALMGWIAAAAPGCRRVATVCTGAFLAAATGLLDGRRVTTHWASAGRLATEFPALVVDPDPIYIRDGGVWTSAGVTAGIDLALALVEDDHGSEVAQTVARWLVMFLHRPGGQTQFASPVWVPRAERSAVRVVQGRIEGAPGEDHRLPVLAAAAAMSVRHFARVFREEVGETPARFVERVRLEAARHELETTDVTLEAVARRCGFGTAETLRRVFHRRLNVSPDSYRRRFRLADESRLA
ncbi:MAG TPA: helix-turn-helix domain-containing protein [Acidimicrobiales bacterium]|jgi:transcriptional regulator GlxA family with amidase domain|nr:helix-turn-helix domain-containing protein [Acidimicrobiales bacterium]